MRCAVLADIHANLMALEAVLDRVRDVDRILCVGDIVGVGPDPTECIDLLRAADAVCVAGDHDLAVVGEPSPKFATDPALVASNPWTLAQLSADHLAFLRAMPKRRDVAGMTLSHVLGSGYPVPRSDDFDDMDRVCLWVAHTHIPLYATVGSESAAREVAISAPAVGEPMPVGPARVIANPGSVGANCVDQCSANYMLLDWDERTRTGTLTLEAVPYDADEEMARRHRAGMPAILIEQRQRFFAGTLGRDRAMRAQHAPWYPLPV